MGFNSAFKGLKLVKKTPPGKGRLNNLNDPFRPQCVNKSWPTGALFYLAYIVCHFLSACSSYKPPPWSHLPHMCEACQQVKYDVAPIEQRPYTMQRAKATTLEKNCAI